MDIVDELHVMDGTIEPFPELAQCCELQLRAAFEITDLRARVEELEGLLGNTKGHTTGGQQVNMRGKMVDFGSKVKSRRKSLGKTLEEVAKASGTSKSYVWEIENGKTNPSVFLCDSLARSLGCTIDYLINGSSIFSPEITKIALDMQAMLTTAQEEEK